MIATWPRQPKMAMWPLKPETRISLELWQIGWQFQRQIWGFPPRPARKYGPRAITTTTDNWKLQYGRFARQSCNLWQPVVVAIIWLILCRALDHRKSRIWHSYLDAICHSSRDVIISGFGGHIDISGCRSVHVVYLLASIIPHLYMVLYPSVAEILTVPFVA